MNSWVSLETFAFQHSCDAYYLNVNLVGKQRFKVADALWSNALTFGGAPDKVTPVQGASSALTQASAPGGAGDLTYSFEGWHTLRLGFAAGVPQLTIGPKTFADPRDVAVTDQAVLSVRHDSRSLSHKAPFGAVMAGTEVRFALEAIPGIGGVTLVVERQEIQGNQEQVRYEEIARLSLSRSVEGNRERWTGRFAFAEPGVYGYYFEVEKDVASYLYQNNRDMIFWTREQGSNGLGQMTTMSPGAHIRRFRQTVYAKEFAVPQWAQDAIYYYIFPDRFRNGDRSNDPKPAASADPASAVEFHSNWLDKPWRPGSGDGSDEFGTNDFFGGDIAGIIEKLDYIAELGANALYITPLFRAGSNHKYDTADYRSIDPGFGSNLDFGRLTREAAKRGIRVIPDASLNHTGRDSIYFDRFGKYPEIGAFEGGRIRPDSPFADWYKFDPAQPEPDRQYKGWAGARDLPELNKGSPSFRQFAYAADDSVMKLWLDHGAAGWRMDVAPWVPDDFWREWRRAIKARRPDALLIAETWFDASKYFLGDSFDSTMNYIFRDTVLNYASGSKASSVYHNIELMRELYPKQAFFALMNLLSGHDTARSLHVLGDDGSGADPTAARTAMRRLRLAVFFQMIFPGAPAIFYGDEVGLTGGDDPYNRLAFPWEDRGGSPDMNLLSEFQLLTKLRRDHPVLRRGTLGAPLYIDDHLIVLARGDGKDLAITATNNSQADRQIDLPLPAEFARESFRNALTGAAAEPVDGRLRLHVPALYGTVLVNADAWRASSITAP